MLDTLKNKYNYKEHSVSGAGNLFVRVFTQDTTQHKTPTVLIPGGPGGDGSMHYKDVDCFIKYGPVILFDPIDTGKSDKGPRSIESDCADLESIRQHLGFEKWTVFGASYGGVAAQIYAINHQDHIEKLILAVTTPHSEFIDKAKEEVKTWDDDEQVKVANIIFDSSLPTDIKEFSRLFSKLKTKYSITSTATPDDAKMMEEVCAGLSVRTLNYGFGVIYKTYDCKKDLHKIKVPTLILGAKYDWLIDPSYSYEILEEIPNASLVILPGGHQIFNDCYKGCVDAIDSFLS